MENVEEEKSTVNRCSVDVDFHFIPSKRGKKMLVIEECVMRQVSARRSGKTYWRCQTAGCTFKYVVTQCTLYFIHNFKTIPCHVGIEGNERTD